ncbi:MAG: ChbG/HpnK family deacetylase [Verrucomicrobiota bacterium]
MSNRPGKFLKNSSGGSTWTIPAGFMKCLIVNADDYGYTPGVSAGIRRAHTAGVVGSTTVMMPMPQARAAIEQLKVETSSLGVGVHLTLTEGVPFRLPAFPSWQALPAALAEIPATSLRDEWRAQIEAFLATGLRLTHLDSHHHAAYRHENAFAVLLELARYHGVPVRNPFPIPNVDARFASRLFGASGVRHPARFLDVFDGITPNSDAFINAVGNLEEGVTEFMVHPAVVDDELRRLCPNFAEPRAQEFSVLTDLRLRAEIKRLGIELATFAALS